MDLKKLFLIIKNIMDLFKKKLIQKILTIEMVLVLNKKVEIINKIANILQVWY